MVLQSAGACFSDDHACTCPAACLQFQQLSTSYKSRKELAQEEEVALPRWVVHPHDILAQCWWTVILITVVFTLFVEPYSLAFAAYPGLQ